MSLHDVLFEATQRERDAFLSLPLLEDGVRGRVALREYQAFLGEAYHHVRHTVPLLMACGSRLPARLEWLRRAVAEYIEEELGHEEWILDDLAASGGTAPPHPSPSTEVMVAYAYDLIARGNPVGFFGMVMVLEGTSVALATRAAEAIERSLSLPRQAFSYLRSHGDLDQAHVGFFRGLMDRLQDEQDQQAVIHAARMFYRLYGAVFESLRESPALERAA
jgi:hypothetical protein